MATKKPTPKKTAPPTKAKPSAKAAPAKQKPAPAASKRATASKTKPPQANKPLAPKVQRFIDEYLVDMNGSAAYKRAGYTATGNSAEVCARRLLRNVQVSAEIARRRDLTAQKLDISREEALAEAWAIVKADPRELVEHIVTCCRRCHGVGHAHQWVDQDEFEQAKERALLEYEKKKRNQKDGDPEPTLRLPDDIGGFGFDPRIAPHKDCPGCVGAGLGRTVIKDTRSFSRGALALYAGVKETKEGFEVKMHPKLDALEKVFRHLGMYDADKPPAANVSVSVQAGPVKRTDLAPADAYLIMVQGAKK